MQTTPADNRSTRVLLVANDESLYRSISDLLAGVAGNEMQISWITPNAGAGAAIERCEYGAYLIEHSDEVQEGLDLVAAAAAVGCESPVILITRGNDTAIEANAMQLGAADCLPRGELTGPLLCRVIRHAVDRAAASRRLNDDRQAILAHVASLVESADDAIISKTLDGRITGWNAGAERIYGFAPHEVMGRHISVIVPPEKIAELEDILARLARGERVEHHETIRRRKNGELLPVSVTISPIVDASGRVIGASAVGRDIGERKRAEAALRTSEERFRLLLDSTAEGIYGVDLHGICTFCNTAAARMLGYADAAELEGKEMHAMTHHTRADGTPYPHEQCRIYSAMRTGQGAHVQDEVLWRADGTSFPVDYYSYPMRNAGAIVGAAVTFLDVTERLAAQAALEESESRFRALAETSFDAIAIQAEGRLIDVNPGFERLTGWGRDEVIGRQAIDFIAPESQEVARRRISAGTEGSYELVGLARDGRKLHLEVTARNHTMRGRPVRITAIRDLTGKKELEAQMLQAQKMEAVGRLAGGIAHDFNNMLAVITTFTELVVNELAPEDPRRGELQNVLDAASSAAGLTRQLLAFSRREVIQPRTVSLEDVVGRSQRLLQRLIGEDIELVTTGAPVPSVVYIDPGLLEQVIMNLAVNARDAMPQGGRLLLETSTVDLDEHYARFRHPAQPGRYAMLAVTDNGTGMDRETQSRIFDPFFTTKDAARGTGLGLATVYAIVREAGGFIDVYSELGVGTTFKIYLPEVADERRSPRSPADAKAIVVGGTETVLLLEDDPAVRHAATRALQRQGYTMLVAADATAALQYAAGSRTIDLLLTDVVMPGMSGRELADRVTALRPRLKVLYMSGYTDDAVVRHGILSRDIAFIQKPFTLDSLAKKVRAVLDSA